MSDSQPIIRLWVFDLDGPAQHLEPLLNESERSRAQRFVNAQDKSRYIVGRGNLRKIVAAAVGSQPQDLEIVTDDAGKPRLASGNYEFNLSHSKGCAVLAGCSVGPIGVDVEAVREVSEAREIAATHFSPQECAYIDEGQTSLRFLRIWTRKEACVKALGTGLSLPLNLFDTTDLSAPILQSELRVVDVDLGTPWLCSVALPWRLGTPIIAINLDRRVL